MGSNSATKPDFHSRISHAAEESFVSVNYKNISKTVVFGGHPPKQVLAEGFWGAKNYVWKFFVSDQQNVQAEIQLNANKITLLTKSIFKDDRAFCYCASWKIPLYASSSNSWLRFVFSFLFYL